MHHIISAFLRLFTLAIIVAPNYSAAGGSIELKPNSLHGASIYKTRCTLCHGNFGMGEGILPLVLKDYPDTNLLLNKKTIVIDNLREIISHGGTKELNNELSPPWGEELSSTDLESMVLFMTLFYKDIDTAYDLLSQAQEKTTSKPNLNIGRVIYSSRCTICHGLKGNADGSAAKRLRIPPANLVNSRFNDDYLTAIISNGGLALSRSFQMPPWKDTLSKNEIGSVVMYIKTLRK